jgi:hypothetical protein
MRDLRSTLRNPTLPTFRMPGILLIASLAVCLISAALAVFGPGLSAEFLVLDTEFSASAHPVADLVWSAVFPASPPGAHLLSAILHGINASLLLILICQLGQTLAPTDNAPSPLPLTILATGVWMFHPANVESVVVASRVGELLGLTASLTALNFYARLDFARPLLKQTGYWTACLFHAMGTLCSFHAIGLFAAFLSLNSLAPHRIGLKPKSNAQIALESAPFLVIAIGSIGMMTNLTGAFSEPIPVVATELLGLWNIARITIRCMVPWPLPAFEIGQRLAATLILTICLAATFRRKRFPGFFALWTTHLTLLAPSLLSRGDTVHTSHLFTTTLMIIGGVLWLRMSPRAIPARHVRFVALPVILALTWQCRIELRHWRNDHSLWQHLAATLPDGPQRARAWEQLGNRRLDNGDFAAASLAYTEALAITPDSQTAPLLFSSGIASEHTGHPEEAIAFYNSAVRLDPNLTKAWRRLGLLLYARGSVSEADETFRHAIALHVHDLDLHVTYGEALLDRGEVGRAAIITGSAMAIETNDPALKERYRNLRERVAATRRP